MNENHTEAISNVGVFALSALFGIVAWQAKHTTMRHALFGASIWIGFVFLTRMLDQFDWITTAERGWFNGVMSLAVIVVLLTLWVAQWYVDRRCQGLTPPR